MSGRLAAAGVPPTGENRRAFRELLVTAPGLRTGLTGVILDAEGMDQRSCGWAAAAGGDRRGRPDDRGPGERGPAPAARHPRRDDHRGPGRTAGPAGGWARRGAVFATWRAVLRIGPGTPSPVAVRANAQALGRYAAACQAAGLVPVVAPHLDGGGPHSAARYSLAQSETVMSLVLLAVMSELDGLRGGPGGGDPQADHDAAGTVVRARGPAPEKAPRRPCGPWPRVPLTLAGVAFAGRQPASRAGHRDPGGDAVRAAYLAADVCLRPGPDRAGAGHLGRPGRPVGGGPAGAGATGSR